jgi:hypothetical protein
MNHKLIITERDMPIRTQSKQTVHHNVGCNVSLFVYLTALSVVQKTQSTMITGKWTARDLEGSWHGPVSDAIRIHWEKPRETSFRTPDMRTDICTRVLPIDRLCGLVVRVLDYRYGVPGSIPGTTRFSEGGEKKQVVGLERGALSLVSTTEELHDRKVAAPV